MPPDLLQPLIPLFVTEPHDLERVVPRDRARRVVVDRLTGTREQPRRGIVVLHDQHRIGLITLKRDADNHLPERRARQRVGAAEGL